jgi:sugar phosphate isomerase/epimerase
MSSSGERGMTTTGRKQQFKLGSTLFSFTNEFWMRELTFEQLIARVGEQNLGPGLEIIGFQSIRDFPRVSDDFAARFRDLMAQYRLEPSSLAINADVWLRRGGKPLSIEETADYLEPQIRAAAKLGFPVVRSQLAAAPEVIERLLPVIERLGVRIGPELHAPWTLSSPAVQAYRELYARLRSPLLGFIPDFGSCAKAWPAPYLRQLREAGTPAQLLDLAMQVWNGEGEPQWKRDEFARRAAAQKFEATAISRLGVLFSMLVKQDPRVWLEIMPQIVHVHCKFYDFDADGNETTVPYEELLPVFVEGGYAGYMSSEWEGHMYSRASGIEAVQKHHALSRRILAPYN